MEIVTQQRPRKKSWKAVFDQCHSSCMQRDQIYKFSTSADGEEEGEHEVGTCKLEGCNSKCNKKNGKYMDFCTRKHHQLYKKSKKSGIFD